MYVYCCSTSDLQMNWNFRSSIDSLREFSMFQFLTRKIKLRMEIWKNAWDNQISQ